MLYDCICLYCLLALLTWVAGLLLSNMLIYVSCEFSRQNSSMSEEFE